MLAVVYIFYYSHSHNDIIPVLDMHVLKTWLQGVISEPIRPQHMYNSVPLHIDISEYRNIIRLKDPSTAAC